MPRTVDGDQTRQVLGEKPESRIKSGVKKRVQKEVAVIEGASKRPHPGQWHREYCNHHRHEYYQCVPSQYVDRFTHFINSHVLVLHATNV